jgi:hypothetical protein
MNLPPELAASFASPEDHHDDSARVRQDASDVASKIRSTSPQEGERRKIIVCHNGHEHDVGYTENIFDFLSACGIDHDFIDLRLPRTEDELRDLAGGRGISLLGFNSQIDHAWVDAEPLLLAAARHNIIVVQWILDHPSGRWPEFNYSNPVNSRFLFHSRYSQAYFERFCCPGALTATAGSIGPNWCSRSAANGFEAYSRRPVACLIALGLARLGKTAAETEAEIETLDPPLARSLGEAISRARFDLDQPLEVHLCAALEESRLVLNSAGFSRCFRLLNDSVQHFRRTRIFRVASRFRLNVQSDASAAALFDGGPASFRQNVSATATLLSMPHCRAVLSVSPVNDSVHDRTCNALNAGCLPILEDNRAHRELFSHGENALLFRYDDDSLAECLAFACGSVELTYPMAERAKAMRDQSPFRFGFFRNIVALAGLDPGLPPSAAPTLSTLG